jgi:hypothetical protein
MPPGPGTKILSKIPNTSCVDSSHLPPSKLGENPMRVTPKERPFRPGVGLDARKEKFSSHVRKKSHGAKIGAKPVSR